MNKYVRYRGTLYRAVDGRGERSIGEVAQVIEDIRRTQSIFKDWKSKAEMYAEHFAELAAAFDRKAKGNIPPFDDSPAARDAYAKGAKAIRKEVEKFKRAAAALKNV